MATATPTKREISRKITVTTVAGKGSAWFAQLMGLVKPETPNPELPLMAVYGTAVGTKAGVTVLPDGKPSEWLKLLGNFRAVCLRPDLKTGQPTGEILNSGVCILPGNVADTVKAVLDSAQAAGVSFAFEIHARFDAGSVTKYNYVIYDRLPPQENDPLLALEVALGIKDASALKLAAPAPETAAAPTPAPTSAPAPAPANKRR